MRTIGDLVDLFLDQNASGARAYLRNQFTYVRAFRGAFGDRKLCDCTLAELEEWVASNTDRWRSPWSRRDAFRTVRRVFLWAVRRSLIVADPFRQPDQASTKKPAPVPEVGPLPTDFRTETVGDVIALYLAHAAPNELCRNALDNRRRDLQRFAAQHGGLRLSDAKPFHLKMWIDAHGGSWKSSWTRQRINRGVQRVFNWATLLGIIDRNPFRGVSYPPGERGQPLEPAEFRAMLRASDALFRRLLVALRHTGARPGELAAAEWQHLDRERHCIELSAHKTARKVRKPRRIMLPRAVLKLIDWIARHDPHERFIFVNAWRRPWRNTTICQRLKVIRERSGVREDATLYGNRHAFVTEAVLTGIDIGTVAALAGHEQIRTTQIYMHISGKTDHLQAAVEKVFQAKRENKP